MFSDRLKMEDRERAVGDVIDRSDEPRISKGYRLRLPRLSGGVARGNVRTKLIRADHARNGRSQLQERGRRHNTNRRPHSKPAGQAVERFAFNGWSYYEKRHLNSEIVTSLMFVPKEIR